MGIDTYQSWVYPCLKKFGLREVFPVEKTSTGLQENVAGLLCYVLGWVSGIVFLILEKENKVVRFHAVQSIVVFGAISAAMIVISIVFFWTPLLSGIINWLLSALGFILWIVCMVKAYQGGKFKLPWAGNMAEKYAG